MPVQGTSSPSFPEDRPWRSLRPKDIGEAALVPTMLNFEEQAFYTWLTRDWVTGQGAIVDLGSFAGGSTACLAEGVRQSGRSQLVQGYDKFEVLDFAAFEKRYARYLKVPPASKSGHTPRPLPSFSGNDLLPIAEFFLEPWEGGTALHKGRIENMEWTGGEIELLVLDASKTAGSMDLMSANFFPHLVPDRSIIVQQDFLWWQQPWIAVQMALLQDHFEPVAYIPNHSVSFICRKPITRATFEHLQIEAFSDKDYIQALRDMKQRLKGFPVDRYMRRLIQAVKLNPDVRQAFRMTVKPEPV